MRSALFGVLLLAACDSATPPIKDPVLHDVTIANATFQDDYNPNGIKETRPMTFSVSGTLAVDFSTHGARFDFAAPPACFPLAGRMSVSGSSVTGEFKASAEGGALLNLTGTRDSSGLMSGSYECQTRTQGPHYFTYRGTYTASPRR